MMQSRWIIKNGFTAGRKCLMLALLVFASVFASAESVPQVPPVSAQEQSLSAYQVVDTITAQLLILIDDAKQYVDEDEERFFTELDVLLRPFIDFRSFARAVMGRHASSKKMASLTDAESTELNA